MQKIQSKLLRPVGSKVLGLFRILFGLCLVYEIFFYLQIDLINLGLRQPLMLFPYKGLEWIRLLPGKGMEVLLFLLLISALLITAGLLMRLASLIFLTGFSYIFFLDKSLYNNHLYLFLLLLIILNITNTDAALSLDKKKHRTTLPVWQLMIFQFQIIIVYFYGGIAKLNPDWLIMHQPVKLLMDNTDGFQTYIMIYGGLIFDLLIGFALLWKPTRVVAFIAALFFNSLNAIIFNDIGIFPFFMIASLILFVEPGKVESWFKKNHQRKKDTTVSQEFRLTKPIQVFLFLYILFQVLFPFRYLMYKGNVDWYGEAQRFSWRMKIQQRDITEFSLDVIDYDQKHILSLEPNKYLTTAQILSLKLDPAMLLAFARFIEKDAKNKGMRKPVIRARLIVSFNGRPPQPVVDPEKDLCEINPNAPLSSWVMKLNENEDD